MGAVVGAALLCAPFAMSPLLLPPASAVPLPLHASGVLLPLPASMLLPPPLPLASVSFALPLPVRKTLRKPDLPSKRRKDGEGWHRACVWQ